jgi:hypothetical protein
MLPRTRKESPESLRVLYSIFSAFAAFGGDRATHAVIPASEPSLDSQRFAKLCRDCNLLDGQLLTSQAVDIVFAKAKGSPKSRRLDFLQFRKALALLAEVKFGSNPDGPPAIVAQVIASGTSAGGGPQLDSVHLPETNSTIFEKLTDTRLYVSTHKQRFDETGAGKGVAGRDRISVGEGTVDLYSGGNVSDLSSILRPSFRGGTHMSNFAKASASAQLKSASPLRVEKRSWSSPERIARLHQHATETEALRTTKSQERYSPADSEDSHDDVRPPTAPVPHWRQHEYASALASSASTERQGYSSETATRPKPIKVIIESPELESIFLAYCAFGTTTKLVEELDSARFMKLCRETGICDGKIITPAIVDVTFAKVKAASGGGGENKAQSRRTISYETFCQALAMLAPMRHPNKEMATGLQYDVEQIIAAGGPSVVSSSIEKIQGVYERLTQ